MVHPGRTGLLTVTLVTGSMLLPAGVTSQQPDEDRGRALLLETMRENRLDLRLDTLRLDGLVVVPAGPGGEWLLSQARRAQFVLLGEEHGVAEVPALTSALFRELAVTAGYRHLAIETGDGMAATLDSLARDADPLATLTGWFQSHWPGAPFYTLREEAELLVHAVAASPADQVLWGLDYDVMGDRHGLARLAELAATEHERAATERAIAMSDSLLRRAMEEGNPGLSPMFGGGDLFLEELREGWAPEPGSEADRILSLLEATRRINQVWVTGDGLRSNHERARWNKAQFARHWRVGTGDDEAPRVLFKFGANHMLRGRNFTDVFDLGNLASELAESRGGESFHVMVVAGSGTRSASLDPTVMEYSPQPSRFQAEAWAEPLFQALEREGEEGAGGRAQPAGPWTVFDLRQLRPLASQGRLGDLPAHFTRVIWGFDAVVVLTGSEPATMLPLKRPW